MKSFFETHQVQMAIVPVDLSTAANNGDWINVADYESVVCLLVKGIGTAGDDPVFKLQQATAAAGTSAKDLLFTKIYSKVGTQTSTGTFTVTDQTAATSYTDATSAEAQAIIGVEIACDQLDVDNGFTWVQLSIADVGTNAGQIGGAVYILNGPRYPQATLATAIA